MYQVGGCASELDPTKSNPCVTPPNHRRTALHTSHTCCSTRALSARGKCYSERGKYFSTANSRDAPAKKKSWSTAQSARGSCLIENEEIVSRQIKNLTFSTLRRANQTCLLRYRSTLQLGAGAGARKRRHSTNGAKRYKSSNKRDM